MLEPDQQITCVACGGTAHLTTYPREDGTWLPDDVLVYVCSSCNERFDIVLDADAVEEDVEEH